MSIHVHCGKPGGGKSYHSVQSAYEAVKTGRHVFTNLPLKMSHPFWKKAQEDGLLTIFPATTVEMGFSGQHLGSLEAWAPVVNAKAEALVRPVTVKDGTESMLGPLIIVDECGSTFEALANSAHGRNKLPYWGQLMEFFRLHRHSKCDIILVVQEYMQLPSDLRGLVERWHEIVNTQEVWGGGHPYIIRTYLKGTQVGGSRPFEKRRGAFRQEGFDLYDSFSMGSASGTGEIKGVKGLFRARPWWLRAPVLVMAATLVLVVPVGALLAKQLGSVISEKEVASASPLNAFPQGGPNVEKTSISPARVIAGGAYPFRGELYPEREDFIGFDGYYFLYADGSRIERSTLSINGLELKHLSACRVEFMHHRQSPPALIIHTCAKGF